MICGGCDKNALFFQIWERVEDKAKAYLCLPCDEELADEMALNCVRANPCHPDRTKGQAVNNFANDIECAADGEPIEAIVIRSIEWVYSGKERLIPGDARAGEILTWAEARPLLDYQYDTGYGSQDCHNIYAYTPTRVLFIHEYDGSTSIYSAPRNPTEEMP